MSGLTLPDLFEEMRTRRACLVANAGNAGDALIALGTFHALRAAGLQVPVLSFANRRQCEDYDLVLHGGGGNLTTRYRQCLTVLQEATALGKQVVVLPHSVDGYYDELLAMAPQLRIFCRETVSRQRLLAKGYPAARLGLAHDMAFSIPEGFFAADCPAGPSGTAKCFRKDGESRFAAAPPGNIDISLSWNGDFWHCERLTQAVCHSLAAYLAQFETIDTDRLHLSILGGMIGRNVNMFANSYFKNRAVYDHSIAGRFPNVVFHDSDSPRPARPPGA